MFKFAVYGVNSYLFVNGVNSYLLVNGVNSYLFVNGVNSYLLVNGLNSYLFVKYIKKFKAKDSEINLPPLGLDNILKDFSADNL